MKKIFTLLLTGLAYVGANAQCNTSYTPFNDCSSFGDEIDAFTLNSISSTGSSGCSSNGYGSFSSPVWNLQVGNTYAFSSLVGSGTEDEGFAIWIDLNNDGVYASSEMLFSATAPGTSHSGNITIPYTAVAANNVSMRIMCSWDYVIGGTDACVDYLDSGWGETEDYKVNLTCPTGNPPTPTVVTTNTHVCVGQTITLTAVGSSSMTWSGGVTNGVGFSPSSTTTYTVYAGVKGCTTSTVSAVKTISVSTVPLPISANTNTNTVCAGNTATLTAVGALNYTWMPVNQNGSVVTVAPTSNTTYTVMGYNGQGCPGFTTVSMNVNPVPVLSAVANPSNLCSGYTSTLTVTGASTYSWQSLNSSLSTVTVSPQSSVSYPVTGYNSFGCSSTANAVVVTQASPLTTASTNKSLICIGSSAMLSAGGADTYVWANGPSTSAYQVTPAVNTIYTVTGTGTNGCTKDATVAVNVFQATISVSQNTAICMGGSAAITAGAASSYSWNTTPGNTAQIFVTPTVSMLYTLDATVTVNGVSCKATNSVDVTVNPNPVVTASAVRSTICRGETTTITASGASTYLWNTNVATSSFTLKANVAPLSSTYSVTGTDANSCKGTATVGLKVDQCLSIGEGNGNVLFNAFPNPNSGSFSIKAGKAMTLVVTNELGQVIRTIAVNPENLYSAEVSGLSAGVYFITEQSDKAATRTKIVVLK